MLRSWVSVPIAALVMVTMPAPSPADAANPDGRIAIIDASLNTKSHLDALKGAGVEVIGRYYARCFQWAGKRIVDGGKPGEPGSEIDAILDRGFAVLSIYQYFNNSKLKFAGQRLDDDGKQVVALLDEDCKEPADPAHTPEQEAELDANAALRQAQAVRQPASTGIYFGVDFNFDRGDTDTRERILRYFRGVNRIVKGNGYLLGAYGSGDALSLLKQQGLVDFTWISASRSFAGSSAFHNSGAWDLFQNWTEKEWFTTDSNGRCVPGLTVDTNIQNKRPAGRYAGFWNRSGRFTVPEERTLSIYEQRRFACDGQAVVRTAVLAPAKNGASSTYCKGGKKVKKAAFVDFANTVRIGREEGALIEIDYDDDGEFDGWTLKANLTPDFNRKPEWIFAAGKRKSARCPAARTGLIQK